MRPDGTIRYVHELSKMVFNDQRNIVKILGTVQDITVRKQTEEALRGSEAELLAIYDHSPMIMLLVDEDRKLSFREGMVDGTILSDVCL
jgi:PAS domain-containing protein